MKFAESDVARETQQASDGAGLMAMVHSQRRNLLRLSVYYPFRLLTDSAQTVLLLEHELVLDETDAVLLAQVRITHTVRVRLPVPAFNVIITLPVSEPPLMFLLVVTDQTLPPQTVFTAGAFTELVTHLAFLARRTGLHQSAGKSFVKGRRNAIDFTIPVGM